MTIPEQLVALEAYWKLKRGFRAMPCRLDLGPAELRPWLGNIAVVAVEYDDIGIAAPRFRVTLSGTALDEYRGYPVTGRYLDEVCPNPPETLPHFQACIADRAPLHLCHDNSQNSAVYRALAMLLLPVGEDEYRADRIIVAMYPFPSNLACNDLEPSWQHRLAG